MSEHNETLAEVLAEMRIFKCRNLETGELELCNAIAMLEHFRQVHDARLHFADLVSVGNAKAILLEALKEPPRQCDVGTAEEQLKRQHDTMCNTTKACPDSDWSCRKCFAEWAQMPYEEGKNDGSK